MLRLFAHYKEEVNYVAVLGKLVEVSFIMRDKEKTKKAIELIYL
ncbi:hypothetical protein [Staphylococcus succinus]|nr:hypothetical protein [Staphylococcus succinus]